MDSQLSQLPDDLAKKWKSSNEFASKNIQDFESLKKAFYAKDGKLKSPQVIIENLSAESIKNQGNLIAQMKRLVDEDSFKQLQNLYFNNIMDKAVKVLPDGTRAIDPQKLINVMKKQKPSVYNAIFTGKQADDIAGIVKDALAVDLANQIKVLDKTAKPFLKAMGQKLATMSDWMLIRRAGFGQLLVSATGRIALKKVFNIRANKAAESLLRPVDPSKLTAGLAGFIKGGLTPVTIKETIRPREP